MTELLTRERITVKEGWRTFADQPTPPAPERLTQKELDDLEPTRKHQYDMARIHYAAKMPPITKLFERSHEELTLLMLINEHRPPGARPGIAIDGDPGNGKTTVITEFGRKYEREQRALHPGDLTPEGNEFIPVVYVNVDAYPTIKGLNRALLEFYGIVLRNASTSEMTKLVFDCVKQCHTTLIMIDDVHMLELHRNSDRDVNNHLKRLANDARATFVYAGVGLEKRGFMMEGIMDEDAKLSQISRRFKRIPAAPLSRFSQEDRGLMSGILNLYEKQLPLAKARPRDLVTNASYIWDRTQGVIGSISQLVTEAYARAILSGEERITKKLIESMTLVQAAESGYETMGNRKKKAA